MEDKWVMYAEGPDVNGRTVVYMCHSWTGHMMVELRLQMPSDENGYDALIVEIVWESNQE